MLDATNQKYTATPCDSHVHTYFNTSCQKLNAMLLGNVVVEVRHVPHQPG